MKLEATGAQVKLEPWHGEVFIAKLMLLARFRATVENLDPRPDGFGQFQIDEEGCRMQKAFLETCET